MPGVFFSVALLILSLLFTLYGYFTLDFFDILGRPGPAFFPVSIGALMLVFCSLNTVKEIRALSHQPTREESKTYAADAIKVALLLLYFLISLNILGVIISMYSFVAMFLYLFNRNGSKLTNILFGLLLPAGIYILFGIILNTELPRGIIFGG